MSLVPSTPVHLVFSPLAGFELHPINLSSITNEQNSPIIFLRINWNCIYLLIVKLFNEWNILKSLIILSNMFQLLKKNRFYLLISLAIVIYCIILVKFILVLYDPTDQLIAADKFIHFCAFSLLSFVLYFAMSFQNGISFLKKYRTVLTVIFAVIIGTVVEFVQYYIPGRSVNIYDWIANLSGSLFTVLIIKFTPKSIKRLRQI